MSKDTNLWSKYFHFILAYQRLKGRQLCCTTFCSYTQAGHFHTI